MSLSTPSTAARPPVKYVPFKATQIPQSLGLNQRGNGATGDSERRPLATPLAAFAQEYPARREAMALVKIKRLGVATPSRLLFSPPGEYRAIAVD